MRSSLASLPILSPMSDDEKFSKKAEAWRNDGILVLNQEQIKSLPVVDQMHIETIGIRVYGRGKYGTPK